MRTSLSHTGLGEAMASLWHRSVVLMFIVPPLCFTPAGGKEKGKDMMLGIDVEGAVFLSHCSVCHLIIVSQPATEDLEMQS